CTPQLRLMSNERLFLSVVLGIERGDAIPGLSDRSLEPGGLFGEPHQRPASRLEALSQLLDLAIGLQDSPPSIANPATHDVRPAEHIARPRGDWQRALVAGLSRTLEGVCDPGITHRDANDVGVRSIHSHHGRERDDTLGESIGSLVAVFARD